MEFSPRNPIVKICLQGMQAQDKGDSAHATRLFMQAWNEATQDFEKFISAFFISKLQESPSDKLAWLETALQLALKINDDSVLCALPSIYSDISKCYANLGQTVKAQENEQLSLKVPTEPTEKGPFFHGTKADLKDGDLLMPGGSSNYKENLTMNHIYFTALMHGAGLAAALAKGDAQERVYIVEPTGAFEHDPNVTNKKFPGNPTRSYRSLQPLKIIGEVKNWKGLSPEELQDWRKRLTNNKGEIIN